jgi:cobalt-zinc-cadmium efflux system membrane fusion protein
VASWLYKVAYRLALRVRARAAREERQPSGRALPARPAESAVGADVRPVLDEEINRLPEKYRGPVVLCYLEGKTTEEAARQLGCARGTICSRLAWARQRLRGRLARRGLALSAAGLASACPSPARLVGATVKAAVLFASRQAAGGALPGPAAALAEGVLRAMALTRLKVVAGVLLVLATLGLGAGLHAQRAGTDKPGAEGAPVLVRGSDGVRLPPGLPAKLGIKMGEVRPRAARPLVARPRVLRLVGSLAIDPERLMRIRCRFGPVEVVQIGQVPEVRKGPEPGRAEFRELRPGDRVKKGDVLAVFFSVAVGTKKDDLLDALVQLKLDEQILERAEKAAATLPEVFLLNARRNVQASRNAATRAENALRAWGIPAEDIEAVRQEARKAGDRKRKRETEAARKARAERWGRVEVRAPDDGTLVERNISRHEVLVSARVTLFAIAKLDRLKVLAQVKEEDLPALEALKGEQRRWTIRPRASPDSPAARGQIVEVGYLIDPNLHTAVVTGYVENPEGRLRPGQLITASITLPPVAGEMVLPAAAVVDDGRRTFVFVQPDARKLFYEQRRVLIVRRGHDLVHVRSRLSSEQERLGFQAVRPGERIVTSGVIELKAILDDLKAVADR